MHYLRGGKNGCQELIKGFRKILLLIGITLLEVVFVSCDGKGADEQVVTDPIVTVENNNTEKSINNKNEGEAMDIANKKNYKELYEETGELPSLAKVYSEYFTVGVALAGFDFTDSKKTDLVISQFNSITCENEMKADCTLSLEATLAKGDEECPAINMERAEVALNFAKDNGLGMRGHTLVWYSQTPKWLFTVGYDTSEEAKLVTREVMLKRMENYIKQVMEYTNTNYPGIIYAWDVVNEAIEPGDGREDGLRVKNNYWYEVVGNDYIEMAFTYARKYAAPGQKLFYNDYNTYEKNKLFTTYKLAENLKEKGLIDGIGMQDHIKLDYPVLTDYEYALKKYGELGLEIQITELDIDAKEDTEEAQAKLAARYKKVMMTLQSLKEKELANITNVTIWGLTDDRTWLSKEDSPSYPLLFTQEFKAKEAFFGALQDESVKLY